MSLEDIEAQRVKELLLRCSGPQASAAEREELTLYQKERPELVRATLDTIASPRQAAQAEHWLARAEKDQSLQSRASSLALRRFRGLAVTLVVLSLVSSVWLPTVGSVAAIAFAALYLLVELGVFIKNTVQDPYRGIQQ